jgi:hypothetical protein
MAMTLRLRTQGHSHALIPRVHQLHPMELSLRLFARLHHWRLVVHAFLSPGWRKRPFNNLTIQAVPKVL